MRQDTRWVESAGEQTSKSVDERWEETFFLSRLGNGRLDQLPVTWRVPVNQVGGTREDALPHGLQLAANFCVGVTRTVAAEGTV